MHRSYPIEAYPAKSKQAAAIMLMIMNNLDHEVAQFPHELVTYGGNGQVFGNWAQVYVCFTVMYNICRSYRIRCSEKQDILILIVFVISANGFLLLNFVDIYTGLMVVVIEQ